MSTGQLKAIFGQFMSQVSQFIRGVLGTVVARYRTVFLGTFETNFEFCQRDFTISIEIQIWEIAFNLIILYLLFFKCPSTFLRGFRQKKKQS